MNRKSKPFIFDTPVVDKYHGNKTLGHARVAGMGYWDNNYQADWNAGECELEDIASFDIDSVLLKTGRNEWVETSAYHICKTLGAFAGLIDVAALQHIQYLFSEQYDNYRKPAPDHTDNVQT